MKMYIKLLFQLVKRRKHLSNIKKTLEYILSHHVTRNTAIIAVGGGADW